MSRDEAYIQFIITKLEYSIIYRRMLCTIPAAEFERLAFEMGFEAGSK